MGPNIVNRSMGALWAALAVCVALGWAHEAQAAGVMVEAEGAVGTLEPSNRVQIEVAVDDERATVVETRSYTAGPPSFVASPVNVVFHRSLLGAADGEVLAARLDAGDGQTELLGELLSPSQADALRRKLVVLFDDPAPLRELGTPMFVSEPFELPSGTPFTIVLETAVSLRERGTLRSVSVPLDWHARDVNSVELLVEAETEEPLRAVYSPYHELEVRREGEHRALGSYTGRAVCSRFDVTVMISTGEEPLHLDLLPYHAGDEDGGYVLGLLTPSTVATTTGGRDIVLAIDVSGSMEGEKLVQAQQALRDVVGGLNEQDSISLVAFSGAVTTLGVPGAFADVATQTAANDAIAALVAAGGTNISGALERALELLPDSANGGEGRPRMVVFLTDGQPTEGITDIEAIATLAAQRNEGRARVFAFGLGADVNTLLLDRLAKDSGGRALYVRDQTVDAAVAEFFSGIADPKLTRPALDWDGVLVEDLFPEALPDLFAGRSVSFVGRYPEAGEGRLKVQGQTPDGELELDYDVTLPASAPEDGSVARLWALRKVGGLLERLKLDGSDAASKAELLQLAQRFGVVTDFTFFRMDEEGDLELVYSDVPTDAVGARAVDTSASISGYAASETTAGSVDSAVRYFQDRNFPKQAGYHTDARLASVAEPTWIDVHFGSALYFELVRTEAKYSINGFASIAGDVRFEHLGRHFRITDPNRADLTVLPDETANIAAPQWLPDARTTTRVQLRDDNRRTREGEPNSRLEPLAAVPATCAISNTRRHVTEPLTMGWVLLALLIGLARRERRQPVAQRRVRAARA